MKRSMEQAEMFEAMAEAWRESNKIEIFESQSEQLVRENNMPRLTNYQRQIGLSIFP